MMEFIHILTPELVITGMAVFLLLFGAYLPTRRAAKLSFMLAGITCLFVTLLCAVNIPTPADSQILFGMFRYDGFTVFVKILLLVSAIFCIALSWDWVDTHITAKAEFSVLMLFAVLGLMLLVSAASLLGLYVALELASLSMYVLASYYRDDLKSSEAGLKYFVLGSLASGMMLFGMSLMYGFTGTLQFDAMAALFASPNGVSMGAITGLVFVLVAFCFKLSVAPFHMWTPDVYEGAPTPVVAFFATLPKIAMLCLLTRILHQSLDALTPYWMQIVVIASALSMIVGAVGALAQRNIKRIIAYSSIGHVGYMLLGLVAHTPRATEALLVYLIIYVIMSLGLFALLLLLKRNAVALETLKDIKGLSQSHPKTAAALTVLMFSMAGIPPFIGFFAKMFIFAAALEAGHIILVVIAALTSVIACFYYIRIVKLVYFDEQVDVPDAVTPYSFAAVILILSLAANAVILAPDSVMRPARFAADILYP